MKIQITFEGHSINIELNNSSTSKAFYEQLPLNAKMEDYASNEKIFYPPEKLSTLGTPKGYEPKLGDVAYYSPWGNVAVFYKNFSYSDGLIKMGEIISGHEFLKKLNGTQVRIEKLKN
ncbi:hypothetical protein DOM21_12900 [Bacteriovorax stolpii]|uniref:cyclophilin-like fold protein n=1 Tax=Bacteriovorax stolpii TaxID=960 RepID=UPI001156F7D7|nr:cyclophilin-like fold protein [Bacteriovorax stolpii]QDK42325.1 hypothetical protein DOM21_12900 [Bacteriovorax stolpii]